MSTVDDWIQHSRQQTAEQLRKDGFIKYDELGQARLTQKGKKRAGERLDKLPHGDDLLLEILVCEAYHMQASI